MGVHAGGTKRVDTYVWTELRTAVRFRTSDKPPVPAVDCPVGSLCGAQTELVRRAPGVHNPTDQSAATALSPEL